MAPSSKTDAPTASSRSRPLPTPVLVLNGDRGLPQALLLNGARLAFADVDADTVPAAGHTFGADNPAWTAKRLTEYFRQ